MVTKKATEKSLYDVTYEKNETRGIFSLILSRREWD
jgi:hypothetical protein